MLNAPRGLPSGEGQIERKFLSHFSSLWDIQRGAQKNKQKRDYLLLEIALLLRWARRLWITLKTMPRTPGYESLKCFFKLWYFTFTVEDIFFVFGRATAYYTRRQAVKIATLEGTLTRFSLPSFFFLCFSIIGPISIRISFSFREHSAAICIGPDDCMLHKSTFFLLMCA